MAKLSKQKWCVLIVGLFCIILASGCSHRVKPVSVPSDFLNSKSKLGFVWTSSTPHAEFYNLGGGLIGYAIVRKANKELIMKLESISTASIVDKLYMESFSEEATLQGFTASKGDPFLYEYNWLLYGNNTGWVEESDKKGKDDQIPGDFDLFAEKNQLDNLIIVDIVNFGILRKHAAFGIPFGNFQVQTRLRAYLADAKDNTIIAQQEIIIDDPIVGKVDDPPSFPLVVNTVKESMQKAIDQIFFFVFQKAP